MSWFEWSTTCDLRSSVLTGLSQWAYEAGVTTERHDHPAKKCFPTEGDFLKIDSETPGVLLWEDDS